MSCINLHDYELEARERLRPEYFDYFAGGAADEVTLRANGAAFDNFGLRPRVLTGGLEREAQDELGISLLGAELSMPVFVAPTAFHRLAHPEGECGHDFIEPSTGIECVSLSGNYCVDKKAAAVNFQEGRGKSVFAEIVLQGEELRRYLKTTAKDLIEVQYRKNLLGSIAAGSTGFNAHYANILAALFVATGQDIAQVVEGSMGVTCIESRGPAQLSRYRDNGADQLRSDRTPPTADPQPPVPDRA